MFEPAIREVDGRKVVVFVRRLNERHQPEYLAKSFYSILISVAILLGTAIVLGLY